MLSRVQVLAATIGPTIDEKNFDRFPTFATIFLSSLLFAFVIMRWGVKVTPDGGKLADFLLDLLAMLFVATAAAAIATTPKMQTLLGWIQGLQADLSNASIRHGFQAGVSVVALISVVLAGLWYAKNESLLAALLFGLLFMVFCSASPGTSQAISWVMNHAVSTVHNWGIGAVSWLNT